MITPKFSCTQDDLSITIKLYVPAVRASEVEIHVDGPLFSVHINPYYLRLTFSGNVVEDDDSAARYDPSSGYMTVRLTKEIKGEHFSDLDLLAKLLAPKVDAPPGIEVLDEGSQDPVMEMNGAVDELAEHAAKLDLNEERRILLEAADHDWNYPQEVPEDAPTDLATTIPYGFIDSYSGYFKHVSFSDNEVNELGSDAERCTLSERRVRRLRHEDEKWDEEYYLADFVNDEEIQEIILWKPPFDSTTPIEFTEEEKETMLRLPRKEYLISPTQNRGLYLTLLSILFAFAYDHRTTQDDPSPESGWTISTLTPAFSALDPLSSLDISSVFTSSFRRALAFPLYRNWELCERCRLDVGEILALGRRGVTRALLKVKRILDRHETYYVYSKIWVNDLLVWVQSYASEKALQSLSQTVKSLNLSKASIGWSLEELEEASQSLDPDSDDED